MLSLKTLSSPFAKLNIMFVFWLAASILGGSLLEVYLFELGMSTTEIISTGMVWFLGTLILAPLFRKIPAKKFMLLGTAIGFLSVVLLYAIPKPGAAYLFRFLLSLTHFFFWVPFNTMFYEFKKENNAVMGAIYYSVSPLLTVFLPGIAGIIAEKFGYGNLYIIAAITYAITFLLALRFIDDGRLYEYKLTDALKSLSGLKTLVFLEGFAPGVILSVLLEVMTLKYVHTPIEYGAFISLTTIFAVTASFMTARISDIHSRRREFLIISAIAFGLSAMLTSLTSTATLFFLGFALINFFKTIFFPLPLALIVDNSKNLFHAMVGREWLLSLGRITGVATALIIATTVGISESLLFCGGIVLLYPLVFELKKRKLRRI